MSYSIKHLFHIDAPKNTVFNAITSIKGLSGWWTVQTKGEAKLGGSIKFDFGKYSGPTMKVIEEIKDKKLVWQCVDEDDGWSGHIFTFQLDENEGKIKVRFSQEGWTEQSDFYASCNFSWGRYMESLRQFCQTGTGQAFGSETYK